MGQQGSVCCLLFLPLATLDFYKFERQLNENEIVVDKLDSAFLAKPEMSLIDRTSKIAYKGLEVPSHTLSTSILGQCCGGRQFAEAKIDFPSLESCCSDLVKQLNLDLDAHDKQTFWSNP